MRTFINKVSHNKRSDILHKYLNKTFNRFILYEPMNSTKKTHAHLVLSIVGHFAHSLSLFLAQVHRQIKSMWTSTHEIFRFTNQSACGVGFFWRTNFQLKKLIVIISTERHEDSFYSKILLISAIPQTICWLVVDYMP